MPAAEFNPLAALVLLNGRRIGLVDGAVHTLDHNGEVRLTLEVELDAYSTDAADMFNKGEFQLAIIPDADKTADPAWLHARIRELELEVARLSLRLPELDGG